MAEDQAVEEQNQEETSRLGRLKGKVKDAIGIDSGGQEGDEEDSEAQAESEEDSEAEGESGDEEGGDGSAGYVGEYSIDDADLEKHAENEDEARAQMKKLEEIEGPPDQLGDWPTGKAMYLTFGGAEGDEGYEDGSARQMGPSSLRHLDDGSVEVQGEMADDPDAYKRDETVTEEANKLGMDKGAKSEGDEEEDSEEDGSSSEDSDGAQSESEDSTSAESDGEESQSESSDGAQSESEDSTSAESDGEAHEEEEQAAERS